MIYLASPYTHADARVREERFRAACRSAAALMQQGHVVFAPIVHGHPLVAEGLPIEWPWWERFDREHLSRCDEVVVLTLDGWEASAGVQAEIRIAEESGKPVRYLAPVDGVADGLPVLASVATEGGL